MVMHSTTDKSFQSGLCDSWHVFYPFHEGSSSRTIYVSIAIIMN